MQKQATTTRCASCGRPLRAASSVAAGRGPKCRAKVARQAREAARTRYAHKPQLVAKAEELLEAGGIVLVRGRVCRTVGSRGDQYLSHPDACNCRAGLRTRPYLCHHRIAADIYTAALGLAA
ncbi:DUF6011 domain-containing protein [Thermomonospora cellulosilytica]|uniref:Putative RNA-binding Zn-ribbon protein involved in translation (DUF1610 family) n=1 Tax=Thermomonospora cellulosilytica TaxID=1411118 RepID=A0A7W3N1Q4_9ACTN|nr:DUF6011 domain-containing protein [Thermomonospora cellulosilytica]MBA9005877.1 putative RNA-binding Zn-ribbon protein involved in translation (DUF1610 family) [Thermomonospora cellulosilytica]